MMPVHVILIHDVDVSDDDPIDETVTIEQAHGGWVMYPHLYDSGQMPIWRLTPNRLLLDVEEHCREEASRLVRDLDYDRDGFWLIYTDAEWLDFDQLKLTGVDPNLPTI